MASCEPGQTSAYSEDLRWRMVWQRGPWIYLWSHSTNLSVNRSTVRRSLEQFHATGSVSKRPYPKDRAFQKLTAPAQVLTLHLVVQWPGIYLHEVQRELVSVLLLSVSLSTMCRFLHDSGFTCQRLRHIALQRDALLREKYITDISVCSPDMFVFVDETGADKRNRLRKYGYSLCGKPAANHSLLVRGERISAIACMSVNGILDVKTVGRTSNGDTFYDFVSTYLLPHLIPLMA